MLNLKNKCLVVVTYRPTIEQLSFFDKIADFFDYFFIVDNTEVSGLVDSYNFKSFKIKSFHNKNINGIAGGLNIGVINAMKYVESPIIFFIDQDSKFLIEDVKNQFKIFIENDYDVMVSSYYDNNSKTFGSFIKFNRYSFKIIRPNYCDELFNVDYAITSGTLVGGHVFDRVGLFNERYFIDHVDTEFCLRLKKFDYKIIANPKFVIDHTIGNRLNFNFGFINLNSSFHSPLRRYFQARNSIYIMRTFSLCFPSIIFWLFLRNIYDILCVLICEKNRFKSLEAYLRGYFDGLISVKNFTCVRNIKLDS